jgi:hypothetical protein
MKKFQAPEIEVMNLMVADVITASGTDMTPDDEF